MVRQFLILICLYVFAFAVPVAAEKKNVKDKELIACSSTKEYITVVRYLRSERDFALKEDDIRHVAAKVSEGCQGAAKRFIATMRALAKSGVPTGTAINTALKFVTRSSEDYKTFIKIFRQSFLADRLDLDLSSSLALALELSIQHKGSVQKVRKDFQRIIDFCMDKDELDLPRKRCAHLASRVSKNAIRFKKGAYQTLRRAFDYLREEDGPNLSTYTALEYAEKIATFSPDAIKNFKRAYQFASAEKGLQLPQKGALDFAMEMAKNTVRPNPDYQAPEVKD